MKHLVFYLLFVILTSISYESGFFKSKFNLLFMVVKNIIAKLKIESSS